MRTADTIPKDLVMPLCLALRSVEVEAPLPHPTGGVQPGPLRGPKGLVKLPPEGSLVPTIAPLAQTDQASGSHMPNER